MRIRLLYFEGCPSYQHALRNLREAIVEESLDARVELVSVKSSDEIERLQFLGSPTIQIDDIDMEGPDAVRTSVGYGCRVYEDSSGIRGWPSKEKIRSALKRRLEQRP